jgi:hypothetical protein
MYRTGFVLICLFLFACKGKDKSEKHVAGAEGGVSEPFPTLTLPYQLSDTAFLRNRDTASIRGDEFSLPDSLKNRLFGKSAKVHYTAMGKMPERNGAVLYLVKAVSGSRKAALLYAFSQSNMAGVIPFLVPDADPTTTQVSSIDKAQSILVNIFQRREDNTVGEGKDVYGYYPDLKQFALILTNPLNTGNLDIQNPIDTLPRTHKFSGDYIQDKRNYVSVRDGRYPNQLQVFIHIERNEGSCTGELKGSILMTSATAGVYQQGGDPCVLQLRFGASSVSLHEESGCGSRRGLDCVFDGTFNKKRDAKAKSNTKKK